MQVFLVGPFADAGLALAILGPGAAPQPATSHTSRARSASKSRRPSPGQDVTISTTNEPLKSAPTSTP